MPSSIIHSTNSDVSSGIKCFLRDFSGMNTASFSIVKKDLLTDESAVSPFSTAFPLDISHSPAFCFFFPVPRTGINYTRYCGEVKWDFYLLLSPALRSHREIFSETCFFQSQAGLFLHTADLSPASGGPSSTPAPGKAPPSPGMEPGESPAGRGRLIRVPERCIRPQ